MASIVTLPITLKAAPSGYTAPAPSKVSQPSTLPLYPAGPSFISAARRHILQRSFAEDDKHVEASRAAAAHAEQSAGDGNPYPGLGEEDESPATLASDPKEWKKQDHYAVLGLGNLRYKATDDQIKVARGC
jgi:DnaJ family protein C protein 2